MRCRSAIRSTPTAASPIRAAWSAQRLGVDMHVVTADAPPLRNLELCINRCHLSIEALVASPYASGLSVLVDDEAELGCACIDFGGGTTTIAVFIAGRVRPCRRHRRRRPAHHHRHRPRPVDADRGRRAAEDDVWQRACRRLPTSATCSRCRRSATTTSDVPNQVPRSALTRIIRPRVEEILELVRDRLNASGFAGAGRPPDGADRRRQPAHRPGRGGAADSCPQRPPRPAARHRRHAGGGQGARPSPPRSAC